MITENINNMISIGKLFPSKLLFIYIEANAPKTTVLTIPAVNLNFSLSINKIESLLFKYFLYYI